MRRKTKTTLERFLSHVRKDGDCLVWTADTVGGYGRIVIDHKKKLAHRVSYELFKGTIPKGMCVLHACDNPSCVNHEHLWLGTMADNMKDRDNKGRLFVRRFENHNMAKLNWDKVREIRKLHKTGEYSLRDLATTFSVDKTNISSIINNKTWVK